MICFENCLTDTFFLLVPSNIENALARRQELKSAALQAKRTGDQATALQYVRLVKVYRSFYSCFLNG